MYSSSGVWTESDLKDAALPKSRSRIFTSAVMKRQSEVITGRLAQPGLAAAEHDTRRATFLTATYVDTHTHAGDTRTHTHTQFTACLENLYFPSWRVDVLTRSSWF